MNPLTWPQWARELPEPLRLGFLDVAAWQWIGLLLLIIVALIVMLAARAAAVRIMDLRERYLGERLTATTETSIRRSAGLLAGVGVCYPLLNALFLPDGFDTGIRRLLEGATILAVVLLATALWDAVCDNLAGRAAGHERAERLLVPMARKFVRAVILGVGLLVALQILLRIEVTTVIASLGITGLVLALAAKDSVENVFGSLTILFDMPFAIGDWVRIDKTEGIVEEINLRSTRIRTFEDTVITVPNANLIRATVENFSSRRSRRQQMTVRVSYDNEPERVDAFCRDLRAWIDAQAKTVPDKTVVDVSEMGEPSMGVLVQCHFAAKTQAEELDLRHALVLEILRLRDRHGVLFAAHPRPLPPAPPKPEAE
ncbi:MAG: mechanosensitive ion channel family protein [Fimbriimonas sp.]